MYETSTYKRMKKPVNLLRDFQFYDRYRQCGHEANRMDHTDRVSVRSQDRDSVHDPQFKLVGFKIVICIAELDSTCRQGAGY